MRRRLPRVLKTMVLIALALGALLLVFLCIERLRGQASLAKYKRELASRGEALTLKDWLQPVPAGTNGATEVVQLGSNLVSGAVLPGHYPPRMKLTPSGHAVVGFRQPNWTEGKTTYTWDGLATDVQTNDASLALIRTALGQPVLDCQLDYSKGPKIQFPHLLVAKRLSYWFGSECQLALHEARLRDTLEPLVAQIGLPRLLERDRMVISELVRIALGAIARTDTWEALQAEGWNDAQLARIAAAWDQPRFLANLTRSLQGERIFASLGFDFCRKSNQEAASLLFWRLDLFAPDDSDRPGWERTLRALPAGDVISESLKKQVYCRIWRFAWLDQCQRHYLEQLQRLVDISRKAENGLSAAAVRAETDQLMQQIVNDSVYDELRFPSEFGSVASLVRTVDKAMRAETERSLVLAAIALKRYSLENPQPPTSLNMLVPRFLAAVPVDYMDGKPIKYSVNPDGTPVLYSVGEDGIDDHGDSHAATTESLRGNPWSRKDFVWPSPASPEEIQALNETPNRP